MSATQKLAICDLCNGSSPLADTRCDRCLSWVATGGLIHYAGEPIPTPPWVAAR